MFGFLQGFAYGLFLSCIPWFFIGMARPDIAVPTLNPGRLQVVFRYWLLLPFASFLLWLTSLWGGFGPSLGGWLAGLGAVAVALPLERRWRAWRGRRRQERELRERRQETLKQRAPSHEAGVRTLDPDELPADADDTVRSLAMAKGQLLALRRPDLAVQVDRLYTRYAHINALLDSKFRPGELAHRRAGALVTEVCRAAANTLSQMVSLLRGTAGIDVDYVRQRLAAGGEDKTALEERLELARETERGVNRLSARNEEAMTALDHTAAALSRLETERSSSAAPAAGQALQELREFIDRADRYGKVADD
ncbi:MAG: cobyrinic acid a,c-diamide synthase [Ectothiorhodospiraceae bacterium]|nr:cobyrinic acid a,c-diamide synthase [Ectothiorhodospiraceae bacterium]MCH8503469.1 cobyrinic acid a,c-diamide synthase [Ectothiorhodospiraceae bacterium]